MCSKVHDLLILSLALAAAAGISLGCSSDGARQEEDSGAPQVASDIALNGQPVELAGIRFTPPGDWTDMGPSGMRKASYTYGPLEGDQDSATVTVFYFGDGMGGDVESNIQRWVGQMIVPETGSPCTSAETEDWMVSGMPVHAVEVEGDYSASMGGGMMGGEKVQKEGYYMSAVVLEGPQGNVFFKLTGPVKTARSMNEGFLAMISKVEKSG